MDNVAGESRKEAPTMRRLSSRSLPPAATAPQFSLGGAGGEIDRDTIRPPSQAWKP